MNLGLGDAQKFYLGNQEVSKMFLQNVEVFSFAVQFPTQNLLAFWRLADITDSSGNGNTLTNNGSVQFVAGKISNCAQFTGSNSIYLQDSTLTPAFNPNGPSGEFTVSCWIYPQSFSNYQAFLGSTTQGFIIHLDNAGNLYCNETISGDAQVNGILQLNQWQHIVFVKSVASGNKTKVYYNGNKVYDQNTNNINNYQSKTNVTLGNYGGLNFPYNGRLDMVGLWNRELTQVEINQLYNNGLGLEL